MHQIAVSSSQLMSVLPDRPTNKVENALPTSSKFYLTGTIPLILDQSFDPNKAGVGLVSMSSKTVMSLITFSLFVRSSSFRFFYCKR